MPEKNLRTGRRSGLRRAAVLCGLVVASVGACPVLARASEPISEPYPADEASECMEIPEEYRTIEVPGMTAEDLEDLEEIDRSDGSGEVERFANAVLGGGDDSEDTEEPETEGGTTDTSVGTTTVDSTAPEAPSVAETGDTPAPPPVVAARVQPSFTG